jgi:chromosome segregation ATPase
MSNIQVEKENLMEDMKELKLHLDQKTTKELLQEKKITEGYQKMKDLEDEKSEVVREDAGLKEELCDVEKDCAELSQRIEEEMFKMANYKKTVMSLNKSGSFSGNGIQDLLRPKNETIFGDKMRISKISGDLSSSRGSDYRIHEKKEGYPNCAIF